MTPVRKKLLHVEDDADYRTYVKQILDDLADITPAETLTQALELIKDNIYDLVLLDLSLPDGAGMSIASELKVHHPETPLLAFSSDGPTTTITNITKLFEKGQFSEISLINAIRVLTA